MLEKKGLCLTYILGHAVGTKKTLKYINKNAWLKDVLIGRPMNFAMTDKIRNFHC